jgi:hypothetical protein
MSATFPPTAAFSATNRPTDADLIRRRALQRLYERKAVVDTLIQSLEDYQQARVSCVSALLEFSAERKCS